jgi:osmotically-inducible protein OsmY
VSAGSQSWQSSQETSIGSTSSSTNAMGSGPELTPTSSRTNESSRIYSDTNSWNQSTLDPTSSGTNGSSRIYSSTNAAEASASSSQAASSASTNEAESSAQSGMGASSGAGQSGAISGAQSSQPQTVTVNIHGMTSADQTVVQQVSQQLQADPSIASVVSGIHVNVSSGKVTLSGSVATEQQKSAVASAVERATGVSEVENNIQVRAAQSPVQSGQ